MTELPWTPDFDVWPLEHGVSGLEHRPDSLEVSRSDDSELAMLEELALTDGEIDAVEKKCSVKYSLASTRSD